MRYAIGYFSAFLETIGAARASRATYRFARSPDGFDAFYAKRGL